MLTICGCSKEKERRIGFAKQTMKYLLKGDKRLEKNIDWESFRFLGEDIGSQYQSAMSSFEKSGIRSMTVARLASESRAQGWALDKFTNWHMNYSAKHFASIYVDAPKRNLMITMTIVDTTRKITAIDFR